MLTTLANPVNNQYHPKTKKPRVKPRQMLADLDKCANAWDAHPARRLALSLIGESPQWLEAHPDPLLGSQSELSAVAVVMACLAMRRTQLKGFLPCRNALRLILLDEHPRQFGENNALADALHVAIVTMGNKTFRPVPRAVKARFRTRAKLLGIDTSRPRYEDSFQTIKFKRFPCVAYGGGVLDAYHCTELVRYLPLDAFLTTKQRPIIRPQRGENATLGAVCWEVTHDAIYCDPSLSETAKLAASISKMTTAFPDGVDDNADLLAVARVAFEYHSNGLDFPETVEVNQSDRDAARWLFHYLDDFQNAL